MDNNFENTGDRSEPSASPDPQFMKEFQRVIESYAEAVNADNAQEAQQAALTALMMAAAESTAHPTPELLLAQEASDYAAAADWERAERAYRELLARQQQSGNFGLIAKP